jgi:hypothetical protein
MSGNFQNGFDTAGGGGGSGAYSPANGADWPSTPSDAADALDKLAANLNNRVDPYASRTSLTNGVPTELFSFPIDADYMKAGEVTFAVYCTSGLQHQSLKGKINFSAVRKGATVTCDAQALVDDPSFSETDATRTLAVVASATEVGGVVSINLTATSSLVPQASGLNCVHKGRILGSATVGPS